MWQFIGGVLVGVYLLAPLYLQIILASPKVQESLKRKHWVQTMLATIKLSCKVWMMFPIRSLQYAMWYIQTRLDHCDVDYLLFDNLYNTDKVE